MDRRTPPQPARPPYQPLVRRARGAVLNHKHQSLISILHAMLDGAPAIMHEGSSLLDSNGSDDDDGMHSSPHHLSSELIERTGVLFQPDFNENAEVIEQKNDRSLPVRKNRISFCRRTSSSSTNSSSSRHKSKSIIDASGVTSIANGSMGNNDTAHMIGTITTTSILNLVVATGRLVFQRNIYFVREWHLTLTFSKTTCRHGYPTL